MSLLVNYHTKFMFIWPLEKYSKNVKFWLNTLLCISKCKNKGFHRLTLSTINICKRHLFHSHLDLFSFLYQKT